MTRNSFLIGSFRSLANEYYGDQDETPGIFQDNRVGTVKAQMIATLANLNEMGIDLNELVATVKSKPYYQYLFAQANRFNGEHQITNDEILDYFKDFLSTIRSDDSKFDQVEKSLISEKKWSDPFKRQIKN